MIQNPVYQELVDLGVVVPSRVKIFHDKTRDSIMPVHRDEGSKVIFLDRHETQEAHYAEHASGNPNDAFFAEHKYYPDDLRRFKQFENLVAKAGRVLDFGCEWGGFLNLARTKCEKISGVELNKGCLHYLRDYFPQGEFVSNINDIREKPDLIVSFHVLEHMPQQVNAVKMFKQHLKPGGTLVIEVPSAQDFLIQSVNLPRFRDFTFWSEHLVLHTEDSLAKVFKAAGISKFEIFGYQRYGYTNHLGWMLDGRPGGHATYANLEDEELERVYRETRVRTKTADTLMVVAHT